MAAAAVRRYKIETSNARSTFLWPKVGGGAGGCGMKCPIVIVGVATYWFI